MRKKLNFMFKSYFLGKVEIKLNENYKKKKQYLFLL